MSTPLPKGELFPASEKNHLSPGTDFEVGFLFLGLGTRDQDLPKHIHLDKFESFTDLLFMAILCYFGIVSLY